MRARGAQQRLSYNELKMSGRFSPETVETFVDTAVAISLNRKYDPKIIVPIEKVFLYDVSHQDTGRIRYLNKRYGDVPIYETTRRRLNEKPVLGSLALTGVQISDLGIQPARFRVHGVVGINIPEFKQDEFDSPLVTQVLARNEIIQVSGDIRANQVVDFGEPVPMQPNEGYDDLIRLGSYNYQSFDT